jgi:hypothetical protein
MKSIKRIYSNSVRGTCGFKEKLPADLKFSEEELKRMKKACKKFRSKINLRMYPTDIAYKNSKPGWNGLCADEM